MLIHAYTRKRELIDKLYKLGLCISYDRLLSISTAVSNAVCEKYEEEGVVCPIKLKKGIFTVGAVDNIDHNPSSLMSKDSFHGTAISLMQVPGRDENGIERDKIALKVGEKKMTNLPQWYSNVSPVASMAEVKVPQHNFEMVAHHDPSAGIGVTH